MPPRSSRKRRAEPIDISSDDEDEEVAPPRRRKSSKAAKQPKAKAKATEEPPKRVDKFGNTVRHRASPSVAVQERIDRALSRGQGVAHRLFLIDTQQLTPPGASPEGGKQQFTVLGATGNVYTVEISRHPSCTCPDCRIRHNVCKHILFCYLRVLGCTADNPVIWQAALLPDEVDAVLAAHAGATDVTAMASERVRSAYAAATGKPVASSPEPAAGAKPPKPIEGDCPICYDTMTEGAEAVVTCSTCRNHCHKACFDMWASQKRATHATVTCVWCRAPWSTGDTSAAKSAGGVLNLAEAAGQQPLRLSDLYGGTAEWIGRSH